MPSTTSKRRPQHTLLLFGPQTPRHSSSRLSELWNTINSEPKLAFLGEIVKELPSLWENTVLSSCPDLRRLTHASEQIQQLVRFFETGAMDTFTTERPCELLLVPLTVVSQIVEYISLDREGNVQGFCVGFLAAAVVASSSSTSDLERYAATAIRLALCIGALIDIDEREQLGNRSLTWSARWTSGTEEKHFRETLASFPEARNSCAYISCITDVDRVTFTISENDFTTFARQLADGGLAAQSVGVSGRYHNAAPGRAELVHQLKSMCKRNELFQFAPIDQLTSPIRSTSSGQVITEGLLHEAALDCILTNVCQWHETVQLAVHACEGQLRNIIPIGYIPGTIPRSLKLAAAIPEPLTLNGAPPVIDKASSVTQHPTLNDATNVMTSSFQPTPEEPLSPRLNASRMPIAVIGMACRYAQASSLEQFWSLINSGKNACTPVPENRFKHEDLWRKPKGLFYGNFVEDVDAFDHRFFNMSAREAASMDPQQRLLLQVSYEAMESAGYPSGTESPQRRVGCYVGAGYVEYEDNVASEHATAYSATGTIRAFISGRVSHYFGWTGPSVVFDTACSSSAVAIHHACKALETNDCSVAIAGGVSIITSPTFYQNLAAASFLSPTGASKAFDADANGYCRGEGAGMLVLKPLDKAIADGDRIIGTILGSAINQNSSCSPITVPDSNSQSDLYLQALAGGGLSPSDVTYVEAHGTGTPVGDPIECASIRTAFGSPERAQEVVIGSVKDVIGHTESASGVAGIIKTLLMMQHGTIPKQPNFKRLNPKISALGPEKLAIADQPRPWNDFRRRTALVNNYGAAGSNAAIVVQEYATREPQEHLSGSPSEKGSLEYPVFISAKTPESLQAYAGALRSFIDRNVSVTLADITYNLARKQNRAFEFSSSWTTTSLTALCRELDDLATGVRTILQRNGDKKKAAAGATPVVLCFGGQTGRNIYLSREIYQGSALLRVHLDRCDDACKGLGLPSLFPRIFDPAPVDDLVALHAMLFSVQYASAKAWMQSGIQVTALVGHSFGQLTALCVGGSMHLPDALRLVTGRARLIEKLWGHDHGVMLAVEGDADALSSLAARLQESRRDDVDVACYNGLRNIVYAGEAPAIDDLEKLCRSSPGLKTVKLANSHAYHSRLADPILKAYKSIAECINFQPSSIHVETCSPGQSWANVDAAKVVQHTREAVHFGEAVQRIANEHPSCIWLEAGSASPIAGMIRRALPPLRSSSGDVLLSVDLGKGNPWTSLSKASSGLWTAGLTADYWAFHGAQAHRYRLLDLPPYQFIKNRHWMHFQPYGPQQEGAKAPELSSGPPELLRRVSGGTTESTFIIDPSHEVYELSVLGHAVAGQSLCPAGLYFELAIRAATTLNEIGSEEDVVVPHIKDLHIASPLGLKPDSSLFVALTRSKDHNDHPNWAFSFYTSPDAAAPMSKRTIHASGSVTLRPSQTLTSRFQSFSRLVGRKRYKQVASSSGTEQLSGTILYKVFGRVVNYRSYYKGVQNAIASSGEVVGDVAMPKSEEVDRLAGMSEPLAIDNFLQLAGIHANCLQADIGDDDVSVCNAIGEMLWSEAFFSSRETRSWSVYSNMELEGKSTATNDIFVLDKTSGAVILAFLDAKFHQVSLTSLRRVLSKLNKDKSNSSPAKATHTAAVDNVFPDVVKSQRPQDFPIDTSSNGGQASPSSTAPVEPISTPATSNVALGIRKMLGDIFGMSAEKLKLDADLADLGVDSLMITEISSEIKTLFDVNLSVDDLQELTDVQSLILKVGGPSSASNSPAPPSRSIATTSDERPLTNGAGLTNGVTTQDDVIEEYDGGVAPLGSEWYASNGNMFDTVVQESGFGDFRKNVYPLQSELVVAYTVEALSNLGCDLRQLRTGQSLPKPTYLPKHQKLMDQMYRILAEAGLVSNVVSGPSAIRTSAPVPTASSQELHDVIVPKFPQYAAEHQLLRTTGARLADCLTGKVEALSLMFGTAESRRLMGEVYTNGPMFKAATAYLSKLLMDVCRRFRGNRKIRILELGAGTGGTTNFLAQQLEKSGTGGKVQYTFSDISGSLVAAARKRFGGYSFVDYATINIEKDPAAQYLSKYDVIISTNCIHATASLVRSCTNIKHMLRPDGMLYLVEHTQNLYWFDLVWGLVEGWWLFDDGRTHALASETRWKEDLYTSGFHWVNWSNGPSQESQILRVIAASPSAQASRPSPAIVGSSQHQRPLLDTQETVVFKHVDSLPLNADIYYPSMAQMTNTPRPVALMIHGGGHVMLSRKDVRPKQTQILLDNGFLPVSVDYRLCPETTLLEGPMTDVRDALDWARKTLPHLYRKRSDVRIDGDRVVAVGWSTGGTLALSLGWTAPSAGLQAPEAILVFYCPTDYEDSCWTRENKPFGDATIDTEAYDLYEGVFDSPVTAYSPPAASRAAGGWMAKSDPRSRIVLHMNWYGQTLHVLINGLKGKKARRNGPLQLPQPTTAQIQAISPLAQIRKGMYQTPTYIVHPTDDDLIPWQQAQRTADELRNRGVRSEVRIVKNAIHLFDLYPRYDANEEATSAVADGLNTLPPEIHFNIFSYAGAFDATLLLNHPLFASSETCHQLHSTIEEYTRILLKKHTNIPLPTNSTRAATITCDRKQMPKMTLFQAAHKPHRISKLDLLTPNALHLSLPPLRVGRSDSNIMIATADVLARKAHIEKLLGPEVDAADLTRRARNHDGIYKYMASEFELLEGHKISVVPRSPEWWIVLSHAPLRESHYYLVKLLQEQLESEGSKIVFPELPRWALEQLFGSRCARSGGACSALGGRRPRRDLRE
ncbi:hypothetical protein BU23DRAFT_604520 [Bimuria novae-zelandiae CBS 107.79]|uniref:Uncharacterized protein n=1 Tax=Bimuria novae-zelandiae CBS 107.79 TaxID=1447943 RepID=A0A6A5UKM5_9PLEO|nr:hypothetical protein BU23DRAFT_604520 [Bimuria novae-zelandiae CBS 107.79]